MKNEDDLKNEDNLNNEDNLKNGDDLIMETTTKMKMTSKMKTTSKIAPPLKFLFAPLPFKNYLNLFLMTSHCDSHTTTDVKPEMIPGV